MQQLWRHRHHGTTDPDIIHAYHAAVTTFAQGLSRCRKTSCPRTPGPSTFRKRSDTRCLRAFFSNVVLLRLGIAAQHLFKILYRLLDYHHDLRDRLAYYGTDAAEANAVIREVSQSSSSRSSMFPPTVFLFYEVCTAGALPKPLSQY